MLPLPGVLSTLIVELWYTKDIAEKIAAPAFELAKRLKQTSLRETESGFELTVFENGSACTVELRKEMAVQLAELLTHHNQ